MPPRLILASASPRRSALLAELDLVFTVRPPHTDESARPFERPADLVARLALEKAQACIEAGELVLAADTVVVIDNQILGKPVDRDDARAMLARLSGRDHEVYTGVALADATVAPARLVSRVERTQVRIRAMTSGLRRSDHRQLHQRRRTAHPGRRGLLPRARLRDRPLPPGVARRT